MVMADRSTTERAADLGLDPIGELAAAWAGHGLLGWSTAGQAAAGRLTDDSIVVTVLRFESTTVRSVRSALRTAGSARRAGRDVAERLAEPDLRVILLAADGLHLDGSAIVAGITDVLPDVDVVGMLAADGDRHERAWTLVDGAGVEGHVCAIGLFGHHLDIGHGAGAGWHPIGPERLVTHTYGTVIRDLDGQTPTDLYRDHLGVLAEDLLANSSMLPMAVRDLDDRVTLRTPRRFNDDGSVVMSGDVAQGSTARLTRASANDLVHDAMLAAKQARLEDATFALVTSTAGRRRVLGERAEDELDAVIEALPSTTLVVASWGYGALAPSDHGPDLHDQTICVTTFSEAPSDSLQIDLGTAPPAHTDGHQEG
jgi:hypothetical protein